MEDFIGRVGQSYLERKAFAVPQQLENLAKAQLTGGGEKEDKGKSPLGKKATGGSEEERGEEKRTTKKKGSEKTAGRTSLGSLGKDKEIARLKKQLAQSKLENPKASFGKSASGLKMPGISRASNGQKTLAKNVAKRDKETKELAAVREVGGKHEKRKSKSESSGKHSSGSRLVKEANIVEITPTKRRTSTSQRNEYDGGAKSEHGGGSKSEHGSDAKSTTSHVAAAPEGKRRSSIASPIEHASTAKSIVPAPAHQHLPTHAEVPREEKTIVDSPQLVRRIEQEQDIYTVEVEEEVPRRRKKDAGDVVEVESSTGRTLYRV